MGKLILLHSWTDKEVQFQRETRKAIEKLRLRYRVISEKMVGPYDYYNFLARYWDSDDTIINIEQDIVPTIEQIQSLRNCSHTHCTFPYKLGNSPLHERKLCLFNWDNQASLATFIDEDAEPPEYIYGTGIGLIKLEPAIRRLVNIRKYPVDVYHWWYLDTFLSQQLVWNKLEPWHCHYPPVKHNHDIYRSGAKQPWAMRVG